MNLIPIKIKREHKGLLYAEWDDGYSGTIKLEKLRTECPCASCREKNSQQNKLAKYLLPSFKAGKNDLVKLTPVGNYAVNPVWGDRHDSGIYPWDYFRALFENYELNQKEIDDFIKEQEEKENAAESNDKGK